MKRLLLLGFWSTLVFFNFPMSWAAEATEIFGRWKFVGLVFEGRRYDRPNPDLHVFLSFNPTGTHQLYWSRDDETGFCERRGPFRLEHGILWQKATWLNPKNRADCGRDPDMNLGRETENVVAFEDDEMGIFMELNGKELIYLLKRENP